MTDHIVNSKRVQGNRTRLGLKSVVTSKDGKFRVGLLSDDANRIYLAEADDQQILVKRLISSELANEWRLLASSPGRSHPIVDSRHCHALQEHLDTFFGNWIIQINRFGKSKASARSRLLEMEVRPFPGFPRAFISPSELVNGEKRVNLTITESLLLSALIKSSKPIGRSELFDQVWGEDIQASASPDNYVRLLASGLSAKLKSVDIPLRVSMRRSNCGFIGENSPHFWPDGARPTKGQRINKGIATPKQGELRVGWNSPRDIGLIFVVDRANGTRFRVAFPRGGRTWQVSTSLYDGSNLTSDFPVVVETHERGDLPNYSWNEAHTKAHNALSRLYPETFRSRSVAYETLLTKPDEVVTAEDVMYQLRAAVYPQSGRVHLAYVTGLAEADSSRVQTRNGIGHTWTKSSTVFTPSDLVDRFPYLIETFRGAPVPPFPVGRAAELAREMAARQTRRLEPVQLAMHSADELSSVVCCFGDDREYRVGILDAGVRKFLASASGAQLIDAVEVLEGAVEDWRKVARQPGRTHSISRRGEFMAAAFALEDLIAPFELTILGSIEASLKASEGVKLVAHTESALRLGRT